MSISEKTSAFIDQIREMPSKIIENLIEGSLLEAEEEVQKCVGKFCDELMAMCISNVLAMKDARLRLSCMASGLGYEFHHNQKLSIRLANGNDVEVESPWFKAVRSGGQRKTGPKSEGSSRKGMHLGLEWLGVQHKLSPVIVDQTLRLSVSMPSFKTAVSQLASVDILLSEKKAQKIVGMYEHLSYKERATMSWDKHTDSLKGKRIILCVDGGRMRARIPKKGRIPKNNKRRGFETPWREPVLFTLYQLDENGNVDKSFKPFIDGVADGTHSDFLQLLTAYLEIVNVADCKEVAVVCDGARWHWTHLPDILTKCGVDSGKITQVLDYTHAKENLYELVDLCPREIRESLLKKAGDLLYAGSIDELSELLKSQAGRGKKRKIVAKLKSYFKGNQERMQYAEFVNRNIPIGSGVVESAIRRVINLRIKAPGSFWNPARAEAMLFLRAKLLYGRWDILRDNYRRAKIELLEVAELKGAHHAAA